MKKFTSNGYSWFMAVPEHRPLLPLSSEAQSALEQECAHLEDTAHVLENKILYYHTLCRRYEKEAGTPKGEKTLKMLEDLNIELRTLAKEIQNALHASSLYG